jgi:hypothetical protein
VVLERQIVELIDRRGMTGEQELGFCVQLKQLQDIELLYYGGIFQDKTLPQNNMKFAWPCNAGHNFVKSCKPGEQDGRCHYRFDQPFSVSCHRS